MRTHWPISPDGQPVAVEVTATYADGSRRTIEIPAEYSPGQLTVDFRQETQRSDNPPHRADWYGIRLTVAARWTPSPAGQPSHTFYRLHTTPATADGS